MNSTGPNAHFLANIPDPVESLVRDLQDGLRYGHNGVEKILSWRTTYLEVDRLPIVRRMPHDRFDWPVFRFNVPLRLGSLEISGLQINVPDQERIPDMRLDVPLDNFPFEVRLEGDGAENYWQLKFYLVPTLGQPVSIWERDDQMHAEWNVDGLVIGLTYWFKSTVSKGESGFASLNISNQRVFPEYFTDDYLKAFSLRAPGLVMKSFNVPYCTVPQYYRTSQWVRFTPEPVRAVLQTENCTLAVWYDPLQRKLGFAKEEQFCMIVNLIENQRFILQFVDMDRGHYAHELEVVRSDNTRETVLSANVGALEEVVTMLEAAGMTVTREGEA